MLTMKKQKIIKGGGMPNKVSWIRTTQTERPLGPQVSKQKNGPPVSLQPKKGPRVNGYSFTLKNTIPEETQEWQPYKPVIVNRQTTTPGNYGHFNL